ncbi:MAG: chitobiase/beta-hexosaminidase C-terminal domain-containing protein [Paraprevotella sp.]|nr:chitobiase/beta-hexosaminidase C-terminal domain-containing protein [Paraprevotella sp.]
MRTTGNDCGIVTTSSGGNRVKSITVTWNSNTSSARVLDFYGKSSPYSSAADLYASTAATQGTPIGSINCGNNTSLEFSGDYKFIGIRSDNGALYLDDITITWETGAITRVTAPVFTPTDGTAFGGTLNVTASSSTEGATIYYTVNGDDPTTASTPFPATGLDLTQTTTLKAIAVKDGLNNSEVTTATYTKLDVFSSIADLKTQAGATSDGVTCAVRLNQAVVTYADNNKAYVQDETGGLYVYGNNSLKAGTSLTGIVTAKLALYNGLYELVVNGGEFDGVDVTEGVDIPETSLTLAELSANFAQYESMRVKITNATVTSALSNRNGEISQDGKSINLRAATTDITAQSEAVVDIVGYPGLFDDAQN